MTGSPTPGSEHRPLKPLLDQAPTPQPPEWLDANIRAAAHEAARKAAATRPAGEQSRDAGHRHWRWRWRWGPIGALAAAVVLGVLVLMTSSKRPDDPTQLAQAPPPRAVMAEADPRKAASRPEAKRESERPADTDVTGRSAIPAAPHAGRERQLAARSAPLPAAPPTGAEDALAALPDTAQRCVDSVETMRREKRIDDARRRLQDCRTRYPDYAYPPELLRDLPPPTPPARAPRAP